MPGLIEETAESNRFLPADRATRIVVTKCWTGTAYGEELFQLTAPEGSAHGQLAVSS